MSIVNTLKNLRTNLFGGPGNAGFSQPPPSKVQNIGMTPTAVLDSDPLRFGTYQFPKDVFENDQLGHYMVFYVNEQRRSKYVYGDKGPVGGYNAELEDEFPADRKSGIGLPSITKRLETKRYQTTGTSSGRGEPDLSISDRNRRAKIGIDSKMQTTRRITDSVALYLPASVRDTTTAEYENMSTGLVGNYVNRKHIKEFKNKSIWWTW